uniref:Uncharacterized protein n=1 Tax=Caudovirales sp. ctGAB12 TaxID=2827632 RepID=A0A8S5SPN2_9CAUD|nr:MAG TPA: hypothetical protein [Caudovirales sp. ctGAB12]
MIVACIHHYTLWRCTDHLNLLLLNKQLHHLIRYLIIYCFVVGFSLF